MRANSLEKQLQNRPKPEELVKEGILEGETSTNPRGSYSYADLDTTADEAPIVEE